MAELVFAMELHGSAAPVEGKEGVLKVTGTGTGAKGETVNFESEVVITGSIFKESGSIEYVGRGKLTFDTIGDGHTTPSAISGLMSGGVVWQVSGGDGEFEGASGFITSNFTVNETGDLTDNQYVRIFLP